MCSGKFYTFEDIGKVRKFTTCSLLRYYWNPASILKRRQSSGKHSQVENIVIAPLLFACNWHWPQRHKSPFVRVRHVVEIVACISLHELSTHDTDRSEPAWPGG